MNLNFTKAIILLTAALSTGFATARQMPVLTRGADIPLDTIAADISVKGMLNVEKRTISDDPPCIYDLPYSVNGNYPNYHRLAANTMVLVGGGLATLGILAVLPEDATAWNRKETENVPLFQRYYDRVIHGPHFDSDNAIFNYVLHPYAGAAYYMSARSQGFNLWRSWLYSFAVSTFFWEFGIEAFMEIPSWQDLIITPMGGLVLGEAFYLAKRYIVEHDYELLGTKWLGYPVAFLLDPVNECLGYFRGNNAHNYSSRHDRTGSSVSVRDRKSVV